MSIIPLMHDSYTLLPLSLSRQRERKEDYVFNKIWNQTSDAERI